MHQIARHENHLAALSESCPGATDSHRTNVPVALVVPPTRFTFFLGGVGGSGALALPQLLVLARPGHGQPTGEMSFELLVARRHPVILDNAAACPHPSTSCPHDPSPST